MPTISRESFIVLLGLVLRHIYCSDDTLALIVLGVCRVFTSWRLNIRKTVSDYHNFLRIFVVHVPFPYSLDMFGPEMLWCLFRGLQLSLAIYLDHWEDRTSSPDIGAALRRDGDGNATRMGHCLPDLSMDCAWVSRVLMCHSSGCSSLDLMSCTRTAH